MKPGHSGNFAFETGTGFSYNHCSRIWKVLGFLGALDPPIAGAKVP
jgi:hypothetical protein